MFLRANARAAGFVDAGQPFQATYAAAFEGPRIVAVAAHCWSGILLVQAPERGAEVARAALCPGRALKGVAGPYGQLAPVCEAVGLPAPVERDTLFSLSLDRLRVPEMLARGEVICRRPRADELALCAEWREQYLAETGLKGDRDEAEKSVALWHERGL